MAEKSLEPSNGAKRPAPGAEKPAAEPVRSRWTPKPEQILILESIFNSGMVNPPKDETVRIRKLLEKFGAVGDANVFYWFQNRRSRSRRRQRQLQAGLLRGGDPRAALPWLPVGAAIPYDHRLASPSSTSSSSTGCNGRLLVSSSSSSSSSSPPTAAPLVLPATSTPTSSTDLLAGADCADDLFSISRRMGLLPAGDNNAPPTRPETPDLKYQTGLINIFINGVLWEVPREPFDTRVVFGSDAVLVHSSGEVVPVDDYGFLFQGLQMGESYFLVPRFC